MEIERYFDLTIAHFTNEDAFPQKFPGQTAFDIICIHNPTATQRSLLLPQGFIYKPEWLLWVREVNSTLDGYVQSLDHGVRSMVRKSLREVEGNCQVRIDSKLDPETLKHWLRLYQKRMAELPFGMDFASVYATLKGSQYF